MMPSSDPAVEGMTARRYGKRPIFGWSIAALVVLVASFLHHGYYMNGDNTRNKQDGIGTVLSCSPSSMYLGVVSYCEVRTPGYDAPVVEKDDEIEELVIAVRKSQLGRARVGDSVPLSYSEGSLSPVEGTDRTEEGYSRWHAANPVPSYGAEVPVQVALWILAGWCLYRTTVAFSRRSQVRPVPAEKHSLDGDDKLLVTVTAVLTIAFLGGAYFVHWFFISGSEYGVVGMVLAWVGTVVLALAGLACLLTTGVTWRSARQGTSGDENRESVSP